VLALREPDGSGVRVDSGLSAGMTVTSAYDPMLAKVAAWGPDRDTALRRLDAALADTAVLGVTTNTAFLRTLLADPGVQAGHLDTTLAERVAARAPASVGVPDDVLAAGALARLLAREPVRAAVDPWDIPDGWRVGGRAWTSFRFAVGAGADAQVRVRGLPSAAAVAIGGGDPVPVQAEFRAAGPREAGLPEVGSPAEGARPGTGPHGLDLFLTYRDRTVRFAYAAEGATIWLGRGGRAWALTEEEAAPARGGRAGLADGTVRAPMPGTVLAVHVQPGQEVSAGQAVAVVEAMKMEHTVTAPVAGTVADVTARAGQQVAMDARLAVIEPQLNHDGSVGTP
jgi:acetyl-CoA/propionyl-CoA carboxylase, biotin carboxylase, biotin carboxyl carrier protein